jgi:hypothetical protein
MRVLFRHTRTWTVSTSIFDISGGPVFSTLTAEGSRRDMYIRVSNDTFTTSQINVYLTKTLTEALAIPRGMLSAGNKTAYGVIGYAEAVDFGTGNVSLTITNHAAVAPDVSGLVIRWCTGTGQVGAWNALYGYTAAPAPLVADEIDYLMGTRMDAGESLYGFSAARVLKGPDGVMLQSATPHAVVTIAEDADAVACAGFYAMGVNFTVLVAARDLYNKGEDNYSSVMTYAGAIRSLLGDEYNTLNGICSEVVIGSIEGPSLLGGGDEPVYVAARVNGRANFPLLQSDR